MLNKLIRFFLDNRLVAWLLMILFVGWGISVAPFNWKIDFLPRDPVPVDAIPDIGENQQIIFTEWMGRSPQDIEDQITYPLTSALLGIPGVTSIRSTSMFGFSSIYVIFGEEIEYYWSRSRILEKLNSLPPGLLPDGVNPQLGPDATALGQVFWYTLEGLDEQGDPVGGWDLHELRSIHDYYVRLALNSVQGVSEVASVGGHVREYQVDLDPDALKAFNISLMDVARALQQSNRETSANTIEFNMAEYLVRGLGYVESLEDIRQAVVGVRNHVPVRIGDIARVNLGPAVRNMTGILDKGGQEVTGGVVVARYGENPLQVIERVKEKIGEISPGLPSRELADGTTSQVTIVPFYDRTQLIYETLGTLNDAIILQILISIIVIIVMVYHLRTSLLISALLPLAVLMSFIMMRYFGVDANIVALSGIAISIGTMVDLGIIMNENILRHLQESGEKARSEVKKRLEVIYEASAEVAPAILTAVSTTIVSFLPVFTLQAAEGRLFSPLAFTKTFALVAALIIAIAFMPVLAYQFSGKWDTGRFRRVFGEKVFRLVLNALLVVSGLLISLFLSWWAGLFIGLTGVSGLLRQAFPDRLEPHKNLINLGITLFVVLLLLASEWLPIGVERSLLINVLFLVIVISGILGLFRLFLHYYPALLQWCLTHKRTFLMVPVFLILLGLNIWMGFGSLFGFVANGFDRLGVNIRSTGVWTTLYHGFPGLGREFMPALDEGSFLLMPTTMPHTGMEYNLQVLQELDRRVQAIPEVDLVVGKAGRAESPLDPAPMTMFENVIHYKSEFKTDMDGRRIRFKVDREGDFIRDEEGALIPDRRGRYYRQWRDHIQSPDDIWQEVTRTTSFPGLTSAPKLQPIETRLVMLQTGMRAPMGLKVFGPDLETIDAFSMRMEEVLQQVPFIRSSTVFADRVVGKPYLEIRPDRQALALHGISIEEFQMVLETAIGGMPMTTTVEGRERYQVRARYAREFRDHPEAIGQVWIKSPAGYQIPLSEVAAVEFRRGPGMIRGEDTFLVAYITFDKEPGHADLSVIRQATEMIEEKILGGELQVPQGVNFHFSGNYENQMRAERRLMLVIPLSMIIIFLILYFQFRSVATSLMIFSAIALAFSGGFMMLWLYGQGWFLNFSAFGVNMRDLFQMDVVNLSVAVWVGFIALFGIATDDGVLIATYLKNSFRKHKPETREELHQAVLEAGMKRVRPALMTTATTLLALLPILTSSGRGADIMIPMAIPAFGGMTIALITLFLVPVLFTAWNEHVINRK
jgi:Cu(I)/Ag(I) efflux system membrane protein CusA/SilA